MNQDVIIKSYSDCTRITMNHHKANAVDRDLIDQLANTLIKIPPLQPVILQGNGRFFSSGLNLQFCNTLSKDEFTRFLTAFQNLLLSIIQRPGLNIALINGHAVAGGFLLASAFDIRLGKPGEYKLGMNEKQLGITLPPVPQALLRAVFRDRIDSILGAEDFYHADQMIKWNWLHAIKDSDEGININKIEVQYSDWKNVKENRRLEMLRFIDRHYCRLMAQFTSEWFSDKAYRKRMEILAGDR